MHGFEGEFSTITMKNGIYKLYIYDWENEKNYGVVDTGRLYEKDANGMKEFIWTSSEVDLDSQNAIQQGLTSYIDIFEVQEADLLNITGWAFVNELDCENQKVYLEIVGKNGSVIYDTTWVRRVDVGDVYNNRRYDQSGFQALIPTAGLEAGKMTIRVYVENDGAIYGGEQTYEYSLDL
jgi:hypothetical protein